MNIDDVLAKLPEGVFTLRDCVEQVMRIVGGNEPVAEPTKRVFDRAYLVDKLELPHSAAFEEIAGHRRWTIQKNCFFQTDDLPDGYYWMASYSKGATEKQDLRPWEYEDEVTCTLVRRGKQIADAWIPAVMPENGGT